MVGKSLIFIAIFLSLSLGAWGKVSIVGVSTEIRVNSDSKTQPAKQAPGPTTQSHSSTAPKKEIVPISIAPSPIKTPQVIVPNTTDPAKIDMPKIGTPNVNLGKIKNQPYCSGEKIEIDGTNPSGILDLKRQIEEQISSGKQEICFDIKNQSVKLSAEGDVIEVAYNDDTKNKPLVIDGLSLSADASAHFPLIRVTSSSSRVIILNPTLTGGKVGIELNGTSNKVIGGTISGFSEQGVKVTGQGHFIRKVAITGTAKQGDCIAVEDGQDVSIRDNIISSCNYGVAIKSSNNVHIGPKNEIHDNNYAIVAEDSSKVFAKQNIVANNGESIDIRQRENFGLWLKNTNSDVLSSQPIPLKYDEAQKQFVEDPDCNFEIEDCNIIGQGADGKYFARFMVSSFKGSVELATVSEAAQRNWLAFDRYQPAAFYASCPVKASGLVTCSLKKSLEQGTRILAIFHDSAKGSSPYSKPLGKFDPSIPLTTASPEVGGGLMGSGEDSDTGRDSPVVAAVEETRPATSQGFSKLKKNRDAPNADNPEINPSVNNAPAYFDPSLPPPDDTGGATAGTEQANNANEANTQDETETSEDNGDTVESPGHATAIKPGTQLIVPASEESSTPSCQLNPTSTNAFASTGLLFAFLLGGLLVKRCVVPFSKSSGKN